MASDMSDRLETLERRVFGVDKDDPGLVMRVDRLEWFAKVLVALAGLGVIFQAMDIVRLFLEKQLHP